MFFLFLLCLKIKLKHSSDVPIYIMDSFGFTEGGTFMINISESSEKHFFLGFVNSKEDDSIINYNTLHLLSPCQKPKQTISVINMTFNLKERNNSVHGYITKTDVYIPILISCNSQAFSLTGVANFSNPNSELDTRQEIGFTMIPVSISLTALVLLLFVINQIYFNQGVSILHYWMDGIFVLCLLGQVVEYVELDTLKKKGDAENEHISMIVIQYIYYESLFLLIVFLSHGWTTISKPNKTMIAIEAAFMTVTFTVLYFLHTLNTTWDYSLGTFISIIVLIIVMWWRMITVTRDVLQILKAHLLVIGQSNIDPSSTPVYSKFFSFSIFANNVLIFLAVWIVVLSLELVDILKFWVNSFVISTVNTLELAIITFFFRLREYNCSGYTNIDNDVKKVTKTEIPYDSNRLLLGDDDSRLIKWQFGMLLPPEPVIVDEEDDPIETELVSVNI